MFELSANDILIVVFLCLFWSTVVDAAEIVSVTTGLLVSDGDTAMLECHVRANPLGVDGLITWSRPGYDMSRAVVEAPSVDKSRLTIAGVERRDAGAFHCNAFNGVGDVASAVAELVVKCKHTITLCPQKRKARDFYSTKAGRVM